MARDPEHRRNFEKLLYLSAKRGDADLVAERLSWGIDPHCTFGKARTPLIGNAGCSSPSAATVQALLDHARRKLARLQAKPARPRRKSPSLDENDQLRLNADERDQMRRDLAGTDPDYLRIWWQERLRAARRIFNDPKQVEKIVAILEGAGDRG